MNPLLRDLLDHQVWADAEHWRAICARPPASEDKAIRERLHHIHQVQRAFVWTVGDRGTPPVITKPDEFRSVEALHEYARGSHEQVRQYLRTGDDARFDEPITVPWFPDPPLTITVADALTQMALHSHYHRGQNATRLRELGGVPPSTDFIVWQWKGRPSAIW